MTNRARPQREAQKPSAFLSGAEPAPDPVRFYEFDRFRIDTKRRLLMRDGEPVAIKAKALDTLVLLVQNAGRLLEKEELMNRLWPDTALHKLEQEGWIAAEWRPSENNRRAKFYSLTRVGRRQLQKEAAAWQRLSEAISLVVALPET